MSSTNPPPEEPSPRRERWSALLQHSTKPLFVLYRTRRIQFVNAAWQALTKCMAADAIGRACVRSGRIDPLFRTLAPPPEAKAGEIVCVRRAAPMAKGGPPWWDITFLPLATGDGSAGYIGVIEIVQPAAPIPPRKMPVAVAAARERQAARFTFDLFAGETSEAKRVRAQLRLAASTVEPVWIVGEPGSGKETAARLIHHRSANRERAFVACDCRGVQPYLLDSVLFGIAGVATAGRVGTLVLKSPASLPRDAQQRIIDWLHIAPLPPRLICTSSVPASVDVRTGRLREEFQADFSTLQVELLPLRHRMVELARIVGAFPLALSPEVLPILAGYDWPGNFRELQETLAESAVAAGEKPIAPEHLPRYIRERATIAANPAPSKDPLPGLDAILEAVEKRMIESAMRKAKGNQTEAAALLGVFRTRLGRRIEALKIET